MNQGRTVFAQLMDELPKHAFDKCVRRYAGNKHVRTLPTYEHFLVLAFAHLRGPFGDWHRLSDGPFLPRAVQ